MPAFGACYELKFINYTINEVIQTVAFHPQMTWFLGRTSLLVTFVFRVPHPKIFTSNMHSGCWKEIICVQLKCQVEFSTNEEPLISISFSFFSFFLFSLNWERKNRFFFIEERDGAVFTSSISITDEITRNTLFILAFNASASRAIPFLILKLFK